MSEEESRYIPAPPMPTPTVGSYKVSARVSVVLELGDLGKWTNGCASVDVQKAVRERVISIIKAVREKNLSVAHVNDITILSVLSELDTAS